MHLWNDGEATILIHYPYQSLNAACLIDMMTLAARLAERKGTVAQTLCLLHNPHVLILQILRLENRKLAPAALGKIHIELLRVERYLQNAFTDIVGNGYAGIRLATKQGIEHEISFQFLDVEIHRWIVFPIVSDELGQDVGGNGWSHGERQTSAYFTLIFHHDFLDAFYLLQCRFCLTDNLLA